MRTDINIHFHDLPKVVAYRTGREGHEVTHVVARVDAGANVDVIAPGASFMSHADGEAVLHMTPTQAREMVRQIEAGLEGLELEARAQLAVAS